jgi:hypothetical protein
LDRLAKLEWQARRAILDHRDRSAWQVLKATKVKKELKASAAKLGRRDRLE